MEKRLQRLVDNHKSVKQARVVGLFGCFDLQKSTDGTFNRLVTDPLNEEMLAFRNALYENGFVFERFFVVAPIIYTIHLDCLP